MNSCGDSAAHSHRGLWDQIERHMTSRQHVTLRGTLSIYKDVLHVFQESLLDAFIVRSIVLHQRPVQDAALFFAFLQDAQALAHICPMFLAPKDLQKLTGLVADRELSDIRHTSRDTVSTLQDTARHHFKHSHSATCKT